MLPGTCWFPVGRRVVVVSLIAKTKAVSVTYNDSFHTERSKGSRREKRGKALEVGKARGKSKAIPMEVELGTLVC